MTEHLSIDEARRLGYLKPQTDPATGKAKKLKCPACDRSAAFQKLVAQLLDLGLDVRLEHRFHPVRRWRFDLAILDPKVAVEVDGGGWVQGAHHRKKGRDNDNEKDREAQLMGWQVFRFDWDMVKDGTAIGVVRRAVEEAR